MQRPVLTVVAPASPFPLEDFERGVAWLRERAHVHVDPRCYGRAGYLAGHDADRAAALLDALRDPDVRCVWTARGGYGVMRLLERHGDALLDALRLDPKPVVGFSDMTALHALWAQAGVSSVHGAMVSALGRGDPSRDALWSLLRGAVPQPWSGLSALCPGATVEGIARGGNLALVAALVGTAWQLDLRGAVLLLEDIREAPYRVDRMLTTLRMSGALEGVVAVVAGEFTETGVGPEGVTVHDVLRERLEDLGVPVLVNAPFGHGAANQPWVSGARCVVDAMRGSVTFQGFARPVFS